MHTLILLSILASDFVVPLPGGGWYTGDNWVQPLPGGAWAWRDGYALPLPGGGWNGYGFDRIPGLNPVNPWGLQPQPKYPGCDGQPRRWQADVWPVTPPVTPWPY
jgi:hypothetical protein